MIIILSDDLYEAVVKAFYIHSKHEGVIIVFSFVGQ